MQGENINIFWSYLIIEELIRNGIDYFCISPGSRSTPLTAVVARHPKAQKRLFYDERAAAYHALGYARATGKPAVLICTSGTAAANYFPAVIEADNDRIPLIVISADRPPELLQTQANQTIDQYHLYGNKVNHYFTLPVPTEDIAASVVLSSIDLLVSKAAGISKGPVHLNCMFREPLQPERIPINKAYSSSIEKWLSDGKPYTKYHSAVSQCSDFVFDEIIEIIQNNEKGLLILGRLPFNSRVEPLIEKIGWPVFADITSGIRYLDKSNMIKNFDHLLLDKNFKPRTVLQLGAQFTSKRLLKLIPEIRPKNHIVIEESSERIDAEHTVTMRVQSDVSLFVEKLVEKLPDNKIRGSWIKEVKAVEKIVTRTIDARMQAESFLSEAQIARIISEKILSGKALFLSNSMPIRDMNSFAMPNVTLRYVGANRGVSGIDGIIASASGFAQGLKRATVLLIGDLAFLHDLNSLYLLKQNTYPLIIILLNNGGGGIFHFLPVSQHKAIFKDYFLMPHTYTFENAARQFELPYRFTNNEDEFVAIFSEAQQRNASMIIEVKTDAEKNYSFHAGLKAELQKLLGERSK